MILGRVIGELWATRKDERLARAKLLVVRPHGWYEPRWQTRHLIAVDDVDAGIGDDVVICLGQPARWSLGGENVPVDAAVMGVVDRIELDADDHAHHRSEEHTSELSHEWISYAVFC